MNTIVISLFDDAVHREQVVELWTTVFGYKDAHNDPGLAIDRKLEVENNLLFVALDGDAVIGTAMAGYDGYRGWIYSIAVAVSHRHRGIGSMLVAHAEKALARVGCMKINLQILAGNEDVVAVYESCGYAVEKRVNMGKRIIENISIA